jgi:hypothetical protein
MAPKLKLAGGVVPDRPPVDDQPHLTQVLRHPVEGHLLREENTQVNDGRGKTGIGVEGGVGAAERAAVLAAEPFHHDPDGAPLPVLDYDGKPFRPHIVAFHIAAAVRAGSQVGEGHTVHRVESVHHKVNKHR